MKYPTIARIRELRPDVDFGCAVNIVVDPTLDDWAVELGDHPNVRIGRRAHHALHIEFQERNVEVFLRGFN